MAFKDLFDTYQWDDIKEAIYSKNSSDVEHALTNEKRDLGDFQALLSPAALPYLEHMAQLSHQLTMKRFGRTIQMFIPLYLSNLCTNTCVYCGFSANNNIPRKILSNKEILKEVEVIKLHGFDHVLLVTGEASGLVGVPYLSDTIKLIRPFFSQVSMEVQPLKQDEYEILINEGLHSVFVYQETYNKTNYKEYHPHGRKSDFDYRLDTPDRLGRAGIYRLGLGCLLGLEDWRIDNFYTALHLHYLERTYWKTKFSISFPRLRPFKGGYQAKYQISDKELVQLICAFRLFNQEIELSLSTRENEEFRDHLVKLGVTSMSAGSKTNPGGYAVDSSSLEQFEISDERTPKQVSDIIMRQGYDVIWKDWKDSILHI